MAAPGGGEGMKAAAATQLREAVLPTLLKATLMFDAGSKEQNALISAAQSISRIFGRAVEGTGNAAIQQMALNAARRGPMANAPIGPMEPPPPKPMTPPTAGPATGPGAQT